MSPETLIAILEQEVKHIKEKLDEVDDKITTKFVSKVEFEPIKNIVYGLVTLILIAVVGALLALVVQQQ